MNTLSNINLALEEIQFFDQSENIGVDGEKLDGFYSANVGVEVEGRGVVLICLSGNSEDSLVEWPVGMLWDDKYKDLQDDIEENFTAREFYELMEKQFHIENNYNHLKESGIEYNL